MKTLVNKQKDQFVNCFLQQSVYDGWTNKALCNSAIEMSLPENYAYIFFPQGLVELKGYFYTMINKEFMANLGQRDTEKTTDFVNAALCAYFALLVPYKESLIMAPKGLMLGQAFEVANLIWQQAKDKSLDINYYTKRIILAIIYKAAYEEFLWQKSGLPMKDFIDKQIAKTGALAKVQAKIKALPFLRLLIKN
jgi:ubiquinone biosynthesis protein COQ9